MTQTADPLDAATLTEALESMVDAAQALIHTIGEHCTRLGTYDDPPEYVATHEEWAATDLANAMQAARAALNAEAGA